MPARRILAGQGSTGNSPVRITTSLQTDEIVYSTGMKSDRTLHDKIRNQIPDAYLIGDAVKPRNIQAAIWEAYEVARFI